MIRPHNGFLELSKPFIAAYKNKDTTPDKYITKDQIIYWYRRTLRSLDCDATDTTAGRPANNGSGNYFMGRPDGWETMDDVVYVVTLLTQPGTVKIASGGQVLEQAVPAGANLVTVPAAVGKQQFSLSRGGQVVLQDTSLMDISNVCPCGLYNFNPYVGTVPPGFNDPLGRDGIYSLTIGLHVSTCQATPSLGTNPPVTATGTTTISGGWTTTTTTTTTGGPIITSNPGTPTPPTTTTTWSQPPVSTPGSGGKSSPHSTLNRKYLKTSPNSSTSLQRRHVRRRRDGQLPRPLQLRLQLRLLPAGSVQVHVVGRPRHQGTRAQRPQRVPPAGRGRGVPRPVQLRVQSGVLSADGVSVLLRGGGRGRGRGEGMLGVKVVKKGLVE